MIDCTKCKSIHNRIGIHGCGRLSMIVATYSITDQLAEMALTCAQSFRDQVDELVIVEDSKEYIPELIEIADIYACHNNIGYSANCNLGWKLASGDFVIQANSDTTLAKGSLGDLTMPGAFITYPEIRHSIDLYGQPPGPFFCTSRDVVNKYGMFDEFNPSPEIELFGRYQNSGVEMKCIPSVIVNHIGGIPGPSFRAGGRIARK